MSVKLNGRVNLLSGHYQDIIIKEDKDRKYMVNVTPNKLYSVQKLDDTYNHFDYRGINDQIEIKKIVDYYLDNNTIFTLNDGNKLNRNREKKVNENNFSRSLYLKINDDEMVEINKRIINKYKEDRIRYLDKILNCEVICVNLSETISEYYIENNRAYITLAINSYDQKFNYDEKKFLETLIFEYLKYNEIKSNNTKYYPELIALYNDFLDKIMIIPSNCLSILTEAKNKNHRYNKELDNMTINDYQLSLVKKIM